MACWIPYLPITLALILSGCLASRPKSQELQDSIQNFTDGRLTGLRVEEELIGVYELPFVTPPKKRYFLTGFIQGVVVDTDDTPVADQGIDARLDAAPPPAGGAEERTWRFDKVLTDANGVYRLPFRVQLTRGRIDARGIIRYSPNWEEDCAAGRRCVKPIDSESSFRLYFDRGDGILAFVEEVPRVHLKHVTR